MLDFEQGFNLIVVDVETTGYCPDKNGLIEISAFEVSCFSRELRGEFYSRCKVLETDVIDEGALEVTGKTRRQIMSCKDPAEVAIEFIEWLCEADPGGEEAILTGHNVGFDYRFIKKWLEKNYPEKVGEFTERFMDPEKRLNTVGMVKDIEEIFSMKFENKKLANVASEMGFMPVGGFHSARTDSWASYYLCILALAKNIGPFDQYLSFIPEDVATVRHIPYRKFGDGYLRSPNRKGLYFTDDKKTYSAFDFEKGVIGKSETPMALGEVRIR